VFGWLGRWMGGAPQSQPQLQSQPKPSAAERGK
jgi:hypothetical protein